MAEAEKLPVTIEDEMRRSYLDYAMSVIIGRAIPNVRDGLKPVHRRILYSMYEQGIRWNGSFKKSARVVGDVLAKYHPHGDSAVYDALVRMAQDFAMRYPLVDGQGNFGSVDGDPAAAMRYTEVKMERLASELLTDIEKDTVDFSPNFDESEMEPTVLPARFPNLLVNGSGGIAVGMATNIPPHNLTEIIDATVRLIANPELTNEQLMVEDDEAGRRGVTGPDFPTAGFIYGTSGIRKAYETGRGRVVMRARATVEPMPGKRDREHIVITEIPYQVNKAELLKKIAGLVREKRIEGISDLRDESDRQGMRVVIELKRDAFGEVVLNKLYQMTALQTTFGYNCLAIVNGRPQLLDLRSTLLHFVEHRREIVTRRTRYELRQALQQLELIEGLGMAVTDVDAVVSTIRQSRDRDEAHGRLMKLPLQGLEDFVRRAGRPDEEITKAKERGEYFLSERQAKAILDMRLARLTGLEREKLAVEFGELCVLIGSLRAILASDDLLRDLIVGELDEIKERYGDQRRTEIVEAEGEISIEDLVAVEEVVLTVSQAGYIKRVPVSEYRAQARGGRGKKGMSTRNEDFITDVFVTNSHAHIIFLSNIGKAYLKKVYEIPAASRSAKGRAIVNLVGMEKGEELAAIVPVREFVENGYLLTCTRGGRVKRTPLSAYQNIRRTGIIGVGVGEGDQLLTARIVRIDDEPDENGVKRDDHVLIGTAHGMSIRFQSSQVRSMGRGSMGVRGIELRGDDRVVGVGIIEDDVAQVLTIGQGGYGKRTPEAEWTCQKRGGVGRIAMKVSEKTGEMVKLRLVHDTDQLVVITDGGQIIRTRVNEIRTAGRNTQGVIVIRLRGGEKVVDVAKVTDADDEVDALDEQEGAEAEATATEATATEATATESTATESTATEAPTADEGAQEAPDDES